MKKLLAVLAIALTLCLFCISAFAEADGVVTDHGEVEKEEYYKDGKLIDEKVACHYSPVLQRKFYEDGYYQDMVVEVEHDWVLQSDTATCTEPGVKTYKCSKCGDIKTEESKALGHLWSSDVEKPDEWGRVIEEADCTKTGLAEDYCVRCGATGTKTRVIESPDHVFEGPVLDYKPHCYDAEKDAKVPEDQLYTEIVGEGKVEMTFVKGKIHKECKFCGKIDEDSYEYITVKQYQEMFKAPEYDGHDWDAWVTEIPATCEKEGKQVRWCKHCGTEESRVYPKLNHSTNAMAYDNYGALKLIQHHLVDCFHRYDIFKCELCGKEFHGIFKDGKFVEGEEFPTETHMYPAAVEAAMKNGGVIDNATYLAWQEDETIKDYIVSKVDPKCVEDGKIVIKCIFKDEVAGHDDDDDVTIVVKQLGHDWIGWVVEHQVGVEGNEFGHWANTCRRCGYTKDFNGNYSPEACPEGAHKWEVKDTVAATCTEAGKTLSICSVCGESKEEEIPALGHTYGEGVVTEPTCTEAGCTTYTCSVCGNVKTEEGAAATGHEYTSEVVVAATCANGGVDGKILYTCSKCGDLYTETVKAPEHTIVIDEAVEPQVGVAGKTAGSHCSVCNEVIEAQTEIPAIEKNEYVVELDNVTKGTETSGTGSVKITGTETVPTLYARVTWVYELSDGSSFAYCAMKDVKSADEALTFNMVSPKTPLGAKLTDVQVALVTDADADSAEYTPIATAKK
jgi:hypothetical protein